MSDSEPTIYQFRLTVGQISPLIWRHVWLRADQTLADLHYTIQICMGWTDDYLSQFHFRGKGYCVYKPGGFWLTDAHDVKLHDLQLRPKECLTYEYNMYVPWQVQIRYQQTVPFRSDLVYPYCKAGKHPGPVEYLSSCDAYQAKRDHFTEIELMFRLMDVVQDRDNEELWEEFEEEVRHFRFWLREHVFDRKAINATLKTYSLDGEWWVPL